MSSLPFVGPSRNLSRTMTTETTESDQKSCTVSPTVRWLFDNEIPDPSLSDEVKYELDMANGGEEAVKQRVVADLFFRKHGITMNEIDMQNSHARAERNKALDVKVMEQVNGFRHHGDLLTIGPDEGKLANHHRLRAWTPKGDS